VRGGQPVPRCLLRLFCPVLLVKNEDAGLECPHAHNALAESDAASRPEVPEPLLLSWRCFVDRRRFGCVFVRGRSRRGGLK